MKIISYHFDEMISKFNLIIKNKYGHLNENSMVYIENGIYIEYSIEHYDNSYTFHHITGDKIVGQNILYKLYNDDLSCKSLIKENSYNMEEMLIYTLCLLDDNIFNKNTPEYITLLSNRLNIYLHDEEFIELYKIKYSFIIYEKIKQYLNFINDHYGKIISILNLISIIYNYCPMEEYKELVSKYTTFQGKNNTTYSNEYIQKISLDMVLNM